MSCPRCQSDRLYQFEASPSVRVRATPLPLVCRKCGQITIGGEAVNLPEELERQAMTMAEAAAAAAKAGREELEQADAKSIRIEAYLNNFYGKAFIDGFFRCLAFYQHQEKEGRIRRLREIWDTGCIVGDVRPGRGERRGMLIADDLYTEFEQLLRLSAAPEKPNATSPANLDCATQKGTALVPR